ncbi:DUF6082 family protein [Actinomadura sp. 3N407]|uniref:DUF6082 family protein n=1 Tax=Actinomadura sp. 3N407 TaxID=3457423 RepID=UPI003FCEE4C4
MDPADDPEADLQNVHINLILSEWQTSFELRMLDERHLRLLAKGLFQGEGGRRFWTTAREARITTSSTRRERRFHQIVDDEYRVAEQQGPPRPDEEPRRGSVTGRHRGILIGTILGGIGVMLADRVLRTIQDTRRHQS